MPLRYERRHLPDQTWHFKRPTGKIGIAAPLASYCILLTTDTGTDDKETLLTTDTGADDKCAQLTTTTDI